MASATTIEERLTALEREVEELKRQRQRSQKEGNWIEKITGSFKGDPDFEEIIRLGREFRQSQPPPSLEDDQ